MLKSVYSCAEEEGGRQCKHADSYLKLYLKLSAVCKGNLSYQPTRTPLCLLNQAVCFVAVVFVCLVCFLLSTPYDITQVADDHMWPCDSVNDRTAAALAALPTPRETFCVFASCFLCVCASD